MKRCLFCIYIQMFVEIASYPFSIPLGLQKSSHLFAIYFPGLCYSLLGFVSTWNVQLGGTIRSSFSSRTALGKIFVRQHTYLFVGHTLVSRLPDYL